MLVVLRRVCVATDDDECEDNPDSNCTNPTCQNTEGSYVCGCDVGYQHNDTDPKGGLYCFGKIRYLLSVQTAID